MMFPVAPPEITTPPAVFATAAPPMLLVPMKLPSMTLPEVPDPVMETPVALPEITFR